MYERAFLLQMRQSPLARTPPANLPDIPGVTSPREDKKAKAKAARAAAASAAAAAASGEQQAEERGQQNGRALSPGKANVPGEAVAILVAMLTLQMMTTVTFFCLFAASIKEEEGEQFSMDM